MKRYTLQLHTYKGVGFTRENSATMAEYEGGDWIKFEDHIEKLSGVADDMLKAQRMGDKRIAELESALRDYEIAGGEYDATRRRVTDLEAENKALRRRFNMMYEWMDQVQFYQHQTPWSRFVQDTLPIEDANFWLDEDEAIEAATEGEQ